MLRYAASEGQWPADLDAARAFAADQWPEGLPQTLIYVAPQKADPAFPRRPAGGPVLFEALQIPQSTPENPYPFVVLGWPDGSTAVVRDPEELRTLRERAGVD